MTPEEQITELQNRVNKLEQIVNFFVLPDRYVFERPISDGTTGIKISKTGGKVGFYGLAAVVQPSTTGIDSGMTQNTGTAVLAGSTFTGASGSTAYRISDIVLALKQLGLLKL